MYRTHNCGELRPLNIGLDVALAGWVQRIRDLGGLLFLDLRDREGITQIVIDPQRQPQLAEKCRRITRESVISVRGKVQPRPPEMINPAMLTGEIELSPSEIVILSLSSELPIPLDELTEASEELRLKYRYLELRKPAMQKIIKTRHLLFQTVRDHLSRQGFWEVDTPFFMRSTPEGARDFLVPSRINPGKFYALPQSPQTFKQILMVAGVDKYFQIVRCFRDEDFRADRQPEFTQIDLEMSFVEEEDVFTQVEKLMAIIFKEVNGTELSVPQFPRLTYDQALSDYGTDKPDLRIEWKLKNVSDLMQGTGFGIFENVLQNGGEVVALPLLNFELSRKQVEDTNRMAKDCGLPGIIACKWEGGNFSTPLSKYLLPERIPQIADRLELKERTATVLFAAGKNPQTLLALGQLRLKLSAYIEKKPGFQCLWITDFPLFEVDADGRITSTHHPFTSPKTEDLHLLEISPLKVRSRAYDLVINGYEIASGSIRIHQRELQEQVFSQLGIDRGAANEKFGFLLKAFEYGVPPHGGIAFGFDRLLMLLCGAESIREVMPFPKTTSGISLMDGSPSPVTEEQLQELGLILLKSS